jgi:hypothetical protein
VVPAARLLASLLPAATGEANASHEPLPAHYGPLIALIWLAEGWSGARGGGAGEELVELIGKA